MKVYMTSETTANADEVIDPPPSFKGVRLPKVCVNEDSEDLVPQVTRRMAGHTAKIDPVFESVFDSSPSKPSSVMEGGVRHKHKLSSSSVVEDKDDGDETSTAMVQRRTGSWKLVHENVPTLPDFYPLERTAVSVPHVTAEQVAERVSQVLWERSIEATYDSQMAKATCMTQDHVDFRVRLYRGCQLYDNHVIIVEVQRCYGSSLSFYTDTMAILDAAKGAGTTTPSQQYPLSNGNLPLVKDSKDKWDPTSSVTSLEVVSRMFQERSMDSLDLALQTLLSLTDPLKMGTSTAFAISKAMLEPGKDVGAKILSMVTDEETLLPDGMHKKALHVLANVLTVLVSNNNKERQHQAAVPNYVWTSIRPFLLLALVEADSSPRVAQLAAKCIEAFLLDSDGSNEDALGDELLCALQEAFQVGQVKHSGLARQAEACIKLLTK